MSYFEIYLIGVILAFAYVVFLIAVNRKETEKFSLGIKTFGVIISSVFSWIFIIGMSADIIGRKIK